jgi:photosystem II stability/assembly factor-like uncharacterized protein
MKSTLQVTLAALVLTLFGAAGRADEPDNKGGPPEFKKLKYRSIGPAVGGRASRAAGVPGDPLTYYAATASGGVWKSSDGGLTWKPIFDDQPTASIGSLAIAPSDPNVIYVGSGEANIRGNVAAGNGIYKSTDAGKTWQHVWKQEGQIGTMVVHPKNPDIAFAAVLGHAFGPNEERGVYRTSDGGKTWQKVLYKDRDTGASDVCLDPANPRIVFAGLWQARRRPWELTSGGPGSGLYVSRDGGDTWKQLTGKEAPDGTTPGKGLPEGPWGKVGVAVAPSDSRRIYALIEADKGGLYRSDDGGDTWQLANPGHYLRQRAWYYTTLTVDPRNPDVIWCPQVPMLRSIDGGKTFRKVKGLHHGDNHDLWIDPTNPRRMIGSNDGGVDITTSGGETWYSPPLPIAQFYHVSVDNRTPYHVSGCMQDLGTAAGPSNSLSSSGITTGDWHEVGGGEAGHTVHDPADPSIVYAGEYGGYISRYDHRTRQARNVSIYPYNPSGHGGEDLRYRFQWTAPIEISPHDPKSVYHAANVLFKTTDGGKTWTPISGDLTRNDKAKQKWSGGPITGDNTGVEIYCTIFALAESPKQKGLIWTGSDDGLVHVTADGGKTWTNVTANIPGLPDWGTVSCIEASPFDAGTAYVVVDAHRLDDMRPYLFKTTDQGKTWKSLAAGLPPDVYLHVVREDPKHKGLLYVGTERGVAYSLDDGATWKQLRLNLPTVAVHDLRVKDNDLVVGTHGRSLWILDDLTPIRELTPALAEQAVHLFPPPPAVRWRYHGGFHTRGTGKNPPRGATIDYFLKQKPKGRITLEILDAQGKPVVSLKSKDEPPPPPPGDKKPVEGEPAGTRVTKPEPGEPAEDDPDAPFQRYKEPELTAAPGVNRVTWDLQHTGATVIPGAKLDAGEPRSGPLANPGNYTLKLTVDGKTVTAPLVVKDDPRATQLAGELNEQLQFALRVRDDISRLARIVEQLRSLRNQLGARNELLKTTPKAGPLIKQSQELVAKLDALEAKLHNPKAEVVYDILAQKGGAQLYSQYGALFEWIKDADGAPTQGMRDLYEAFARELQQHATTFNGLRSGDVTQLNALAQKLDLPSVFLPEEKDAAAVPSG